MKRVVTVTKNNALVNIEDNKDSNITVTINQIDELSCDNIRRNCENVSKLEEDFSERLDYSKEILTKKLLPKQLQSDFEIVPKYHGNKVDFEASPITSDAYDKFPMRMNYTMKFDNIEEAQKFRENGLADLIKKADETGKPVEIPNITSMKEFLGEYENPVGHANKYGSEGIKLYICPKPLPPAQNYKIEIFNPDFSFNINTKLRLKSKSNDNIVLSNYESIDEPYSIEISLNDMNKDENGISGKFNIKILLKEEYYDSCNYSREIIKYNYLIEDYDNHIKISNIDLGKNIFSFDNCGSIKHKKSDIKKLNRTINLIDKVEFISKVKNIDVKYDLKEFARNEELINLVYCECIGKNYNSKKSMTFTDKIPINAETTKFCEQKNKFNIISQLYYVDLFGVRIEMKDNKLLLDNCLIESIKKTKKHYYYKITSNSIKFRVKKKKGSEINE